MNEKHLKKNGGKNLQSTVGLGTAVYLRTDEMRGFTLFDDLALTLHPPSIAFTRSLLPFPAGRILAMGGGTESQVDLCCATAHCYLSRASLTKVPGWPLIFASIHKPDFQDLSSNQHLHLLLPAPQAPHFPGLTVSCAEPQCVICLLVCGSLMSVPAAASK